MNDSPYGLTASHLDRRTPTAPPHWARRSKPGTVFMNRADYLDPALTWTGRARIPGAAPACPTSGFHVGHPAEILPSEEGDEMSDTKPCRIELVLPDRDQIRRRAASRNWPTTARRRA